MQSMASQLSFITSVHVHFELAIAELFRLLALNSKMFCTIVILLHHGYAICRDTRNVPRSAEHSAECFVIFGKFFVPLFDGGTGKVKRNLYFWHFSDFFFNFTYFLVILYLPKPKILFS